MKLIIATLALLAVSTAAYAACSTHTVFSNGKLITCTTCCTGSHCTTTCI